MSNLPIPTLRSKRKKIPVFGEDLDEMATHTGMIVPPLVVDAIIW